MDNRTEQYSLWELLESITENLKTKRLADVFRFISFYPGETYGPHQHLRIEINYVKKGSCILHLDNESITFREGEIMIITSDISHLFEAGADGTTLMQLEFLPEIFSHFSLNATVDSNGSALTPVFLFSQENRLIKIVNNIRIMRVVQRIVNELEEKSSYYQYLVIMYYAELLILIYRYKDEAALLDAAEDVDTTYIQDVLPGKMKYNLRSIQEYSFFKDIETMFQTVFAVVEKNS